MSTAVCGCQGYSSNKAPDRSPRKHKCQHKLSRSNAHFCLVHDQKHQTFLSSSNQHKNNVFFSKRPACSQWYVQKKHHSGWGFCTASVLTLNFCDKALRKVPSATVIRPWYPTPAAPPEPKQPSNVTATTTTTPTASTPQAVREPQLTHPPPSKERDPSLSRLNNSKERDASLSRLIPSKERDASLSRLIPNKERDTSLSHVVTSLGRLITSLGLFINSKERDTSLRRLITSLRRLITSLSRLINSEEADTFLSRLITSLSHLITYLRRLITYLGRLINSTRTHTRKGLRSRSRSPSCLSPKHSNNSSSCRGGSKEKDRRSPKDDGRSSSPTKGQKNQRAHSREGRGIADRGGTTGGKRSQSDCRKRLRETPQEVMTSGVKKQRTGHTDGGVDGRTENSERRTKALPATQIRFWFPKPPAPPEPKQPSNVTATTSTTSTAPREESPPKILDFNYRKGFPPLKSLPGLKFKRRTCPRDTVDRMWKSPLAECQHLGEEVKSGYTRSFPKRRADAPSLPSQDPPRFKRARLSPLPPPPMQRFDGPRFNSGPMGFQPHPQCFEPMFDGPAPRPRPGFDGPRFEQQFPQQQ